MSVITKRGDQGTTDLLFAKKADKTSARVEALGAVDELSAHLGLARVHTTSSEFSEWIDTTQKHLINLMGELATEAEDYPKYKAKGYGTITDEEIAALETLCKTYENAGTTFKGWIRAGQDKDPLTAQLHVCRTVCRRAERRTWAVDLPSRLPSIFLNRLADILWLIGNPKVSS